MLYVVMASAAVSSDFKKWLCAKLNALNVDQDVFSSYITSILEGDDPGEEKLEALEGILIEIVTDGNANASGQEILDKWTEFHQAKSTRHGTEKPKAECQLSAIIKKHAKSVVSTEQKNSNAPKKNHEAILAQYGQVSDDEIDDVCDEDENDAADCKAKSNSIDSAIAKNSNVDNVMKAEKEKRDKNKTESEKRKAQDKLNREKQKQEQEERKDRERKRTQKGERKR